MENVLIDDTYIVMVDQCAVWRQKIYKRQSHLHMKDKIDETDKKQAQQQGDNLLRNLRKQYLRDIYTLSKSIKVLTLYPCQNSPLIKLQGKANFLPWLSNFPVKEVVIIKQVGDHLLHANIFVRCL